MNRQFVECGTRRFCNAGRWIRIAIGPVKNWRVASGESRKLLPEELERSMAIYEAEMESKTVAKTVARNPIRRIY